MNKNSVLLKCSFCYLPYSVKASRAEKSRFCSFKCKCEMQKIELAGRQMPVECRKEVPWPHSRVGPAKKCGHLAKKGRNYCTRCREKIYPDCNYNCMSCGAKMSGSPSQAKKYKCCSMDCRNKMVSNRQSGAKSHLWKGGLCSENIILRGSAQYDKWRKDVFARDNYTCVWCGQRGGRLTADHIKQWSLYPALRFDLQNGRTMCRGCHTKTENFGGRATAEINKRMIGGTLQYELI